MKRSNYAAQARQSSTNPVNKGRGIGPRAKILLAAFSVMLVLLVIYSATNPSTNNASLEAIVLSSKYATNKPVAPITAAKETKDDAASTNKSPNSNKGSQPEKATAEKPKEAKAEGAEKAPKQESTELAAPAAIEKPQANNADKAQPVAVAALNIPSPEPKQNLSAVQGVPQNQGQAKISGNKLVAGFPVNNKTPEYPGDKKGLEYPDDKKAPEYPAKQDITEYAANQVVVDY